MKSLAIRKRLPRQAGGNQRGSVVIWIAVSLVGLLAFSVLAIDGALLFTTKTQLQNAADAAALAGAGGLAKGSKDLARQLAIGIAAHNMAQEDSGLEPVRITNADISFPTPTQIRVVTHRTQATGDPLRGFFLQVINPASHNLTDVTATATAEVAELCSSLCVKPWAIPDRWTDANADGVYDDGDTYDPLLTGYQAPLDTGRSMILKVGAPSQTISPGVFFPVDLPPVGSDGGPLTGGSWYRNWIRTCAPYPVGPGDELQVEPGNMVGPTTQGMDELMAMDPGASWDPTTNTVVNSRFGLSPRIALVPLFDPRFPPTSGRNYVTVSKIGAFFLESIGPGSQVTGRFLEINAMGAPCDHPTGKSFVMGLHLVH